MKIYIGDHLGEHKTTRELEKWLTSKGHEVHWDVYYENVKGPDSRSWIEWADIVFFEWCEGMVNLCLKDGWAKKKPIYCRAMDIEIWAGQAEAEDLNGLTGLAYTSKAYYKVLEDGWKRLGKKYSFPKTHIPLSIDMSEWTYKERTPQYNVAVIGHMWDSKNPSLIPHFVHYLINRTKNKEWKFYIQGYWRHDVWRWYYEYMKHIIVEMGLQNNIFLSEDRIDSLDTWLEDKSYLVTFSMKDAFSLIVGEAMAKGVKALPHNFIGAKDIWGKYVWTTFDELARKMVDDDYNSKEYYQFVRDNYSNEKIMPIWENFLNI